MNAKRWTKRQRTRTELPVVAAMFAGLVAVSCGGGSADDDPVPVDVPVGLTVHCEAARDGGTIPGDGTWIDASLTDGTCLLYRFDTEAAAQYSVHVLMAAGGNVDVIVASTAEFMDLVTASNAFGDDPEAASFVSPSGGTYHIAIISTPSTPPPMISISSACAGSIPARASSCAWPPTPRSGNP